jgi:hypothetical protein
MDNQGQQGTSFKNMNGRQKLIFVCKLTVCILSFGIVFPNIMSE